MSEPDDSPPGAPPTAPAIAALGGRTLDIDEEVGWLEVEFTRPGNMAPSRLREMLEALLSEAVSAAAAFPGPGFTATTRSTVPPNPPVETLIGRARVMPAGDHVAFVESELRTIGGQFVGGASGMVRFAGSSG